MPAPLIPVGVAAAARYLAKNGAKKAIEKYGKTIVTKATQYGKKKVSDEVKAAGERAVEASAVTAAREQELFGMTKIGGKDTKTPNQRIAESLSLSLSLSLSQNQNPGRSRNPSRNPSREGAYEAKFTPSAASNLQLRIATREPQNHCSGRSGSN